MALIVGSRRRIWRKREVKRGSGWRREATGQIEAVLIGGGGRSGGMGGGRREEAAGNWER